VCRCIPHTGEEGLEHGAASSADGDGLHSFTSSALRRLEEDAPTP